MTRSIAVRCEVSFGPASLKLLLGFGFQPALAYTYAAMHVVYILRCGDGTLYTGAAKDLARRLAQHAAGSASRYTRARLPVTLLWSRRERSWSYALQTEHRIKQLSRSAKDAIIGGARLRVRRR